MDTKSKGWKAVVSFICFALGGILLLISIPLGVAAIYAREGIWTEIQGDYQKTRQFEWRISGATRSLFRAALEGGSWEGEGLSDPNLLWEVREDGKVTRRSNPGISLKDGPPEGYTFFLHFDGAKVTAIKDGEAINPSLYLERPGTDAARLELYLAAPAVPVRYAEGSGLYEIPRYQEHVRQTVLWFCAIPVSGVVLFALYILLRRDKIRADTAIARLTGRIWFEVKILSFPVLYFGVLYLVPWILDRAWWTYNQNIQLLTLCATLLSLGYLAVNDLRRNGWHAVVHQSLCGMLSRLWRCQELKRPVEKRLQRRAIAAFGTMVPFALMSAWWGWFDCLPWAVNRSTDREGMFVFVPLALLGLFCLLAQIFFLRQSMADAHLVNEGLEEAVGERMRSERMKVELITNVSHDLKTPLTSIISYTELLSREEGLPDHVNDYIKILGEKSERLKTMVQEVFEVSKAATGNLPLNLEEIDLCKLISQTLADMSERIAQSGLTVREQLPSGAIPIRADGGRMYRVFQNLIQNALAYSLEGSRIYVTLEAADGRAVATVRNTSKEELGPDMDFTGRFVRGDESRSDGGSGLGLSIAKTFTEACGGAFRVETAGDLFTVTVEFPISI